jgi:hypothetical protein
VSSASLFGWLAIGLAMFGAAGVLTVPLWGDALASGFDRSGAYADAYYLVVDYGVAGSWLAALFLAGVSLILWGRRRD